MAKKISEVEPERKLNKAGVIAAIAEANELFGTDFALGAKRCPIGRWACRFCDYRSGELVSRGG